MCVHVSEIRKRQRLGVRQKERDRDRVSQSKNIPFSFLVELTENVL